MDLYKEDWIGFRILDEVGWVIYIVFFGDYLSINDV